MGLYRNINRTIDDNISKARRKCRCGHSIIIKKVFKNCDYFICNWCGGRLYYDLEKQKVHDEQCKKEEFRMIVRNKIKKESKKKRRKYEKTKGINYGRPKGSFRSTI